MLGYTQVIWDNESGEEPQPSSSNTTWGALTEQEKAAAMVLGYTETIWNDESGSELQPASAIKYWIELTVCGERGCALHRVCALCCVHDDST